VYVNRGTVIGGNAEQSFDLLSTSGRCVGCTESHRESALLQPLLDEINHFADLLIGGRLIRARAAGKKTSLITHDDHAHRDMAYAHPIIDQLTVFSLGIPRIYVTRSHFEL
jgi:hypothetical protein